MEPITAALILGGAGLISGIMGGMNEAKRRKQELVMQANQQAFESSQRGAEKMGSNQQNSFQQLMDAYKQALL